MTDMYKLEKGSIVKSGAYCSFKAKFVNDNCWEGCCVYCRYREVMIDEVVGTKQGWKRNGYKNGKWKDYPSYRYEAQLTISNVIKYD